MLIWKAYEKKVRSLAFSPDGTRIATTAEDSKFISLWNPSTGQRVGELRESYSPVRTLAFFPDGRHIAGTLELGGVQIWEVEMGVGGPLLVGVASVRDALAVSPDGSHLLAGAPEGFGEWRDPTALAREHPRPPDRVYPVPHRGPTRIGFSPAGTYFCVAEWYMHLFHPKPFKPYRQFRDPLSKAAPEGMEGASVKAFAFTPDESRLVLALGHRAVVWSPADLDAEPVLIAGHGKKVMAVGFLPDGNVLTAGMDGTARVWDSNTGADIRSFDWGIGKVRVAAVSPDGTLCAAGSDDGHIVVWDVDF